MEREIDRDESSSERDALEHEPSCTDATGDEGEMDLLLSEDGEARRRFLKQALIAGGGLAAANLLLHYQMNVSAQSPMAAASFASKTACLRLMRRRVRC